MTTIAYRDGIMAADTGLFDRGTYSGQVTKIWRRDDGGLGGVTGCLGDSAAFRDWFLANSDDESPKFKDDDSEGVIVHRDGRIEWFGNDQRRFDVTPSYCVLGAGFRIAMGAMAAGADAVRAVEIAAELDVYTQLPIISVTHSGRSLK